MFSVHGHWRILVKNNYVLQWFRGCWNIEAALQYKNEFKDKTAHLTGTKWAIVSFFDDWELGVPEIESHLHDHCERFSANGCVKDCHVYSPNAVKNMQLEKIVPQSECTYERRVFSNAKDATIWMKSCGFNIDISHFLDNCSTQ